MMSAEGERLLTPYTHAQLASMIEASGEAITKTLGTLREDKLVSWGAVSFMLDPPRKQ